MSLINNKQVWKGVFAYMDGYKETDQEIIVDFTMELFFNDGSFTGTSTDSESEALFDKPATVKGFIDENKISFVLKYPCYYYRDENRQLALNRDFEHPEIHYLGYWDEDGNSFRGMWEMEVDTDVHLDYDPEEIANGAFEIHRIE